MKKTALLIVAVVTPLAFVAAFAAMKLMSHSTPAPVSAARPTPAPSVVSTDPG